MLEIHPDYEKNRLFLNYKGLVEYDDVEFFIEETKEIFKKFQPGFGLITNLLEVKSIDDDVRTFIGDAMKVAQDGGLGHAIRIIPQTSVGEMNALIFDKKSATVGYVAHVVYSMEEAEKLLDKLESDEG